MPWVGAERLPSILSGGEAYKSNLRTLVVGKSTATDYGCSLASHRKSKLETHILTHKASEKQIHWMVLGSRLMR